MVKVSRNPINIGSINTGHINIGAASINQTPLDWTGNFSRILSAINAAKKQKIKLLCLPELCITGYGCEDYFHAPHVLERAFEYLNKITASTSNIAVLVGLPVGFRNRVFNCAALVADKKIQGIIAKKFLASEGVHYEPRFFQPWQVAEVSKLNGITFGDMIFNLDGVKIAVEICQDAWVLERPGSLYTKHGVDIILNPSASHFAIGKQAVRRGIATGSSRVLGVTYVFCNLLGCEAGRTIYDGDCRIVSEGEVVAENTPFLFEDFSLISSEIDINSCRGKQLRKVEEFSAENKVFVREIGLNFSLSAKASSKPGLKKNRLDNSTISLNLESEDPSIIPTSKYEDLFNAVTLGTFDYLRKSRSKGFVISLSGGADSSITTLLAVYSLKRAWDGLGRSEFLKRLKHIDKIKGVKNIDEVIKILITTVYQATINNSQDTINSAEELATALGTEHHFIRVDKTVDTYISEISKRLKINIDWENYDIPLQNIQARVRSPSVWMIANIKKALLLSTGNRSEASVGYCTIDGDTSGGLDLIGDLSKAIILKWLRWFEDTGPVNYGKIKGLKKVNRLTPSAELRPIKRAQTDEKDLMPYKALQVIERLAILDKLSPVSIYQNLVDHYKGKFTKQELQLWVKRFFQLWAANQWKRDRLAPSFHLDNYSVDSRTWMRFPILSGGFEEELAELDRYCKNRKN